jgi:SNF2 family DNA or RNA helicase
VTNAPILPFLQAPPDKPFLLNKRFSVPRVVDSKAFASNKLVQTERKRGTLGARRKRPGDDIQVGGFKRVAGMLSFEDEEPTAFPVDEEDDAASSIGTPATKCDVDPSYVPVVLWVPPELGSAAEWDKQCAEALEAGEKPPTPPPGSVVVDPQIGKFLRPHQREGVRFMFECVCGDRVLTTGPEVLKIGKFAPPKEPKPPKTKPVLPESDDDDGLMEESLTMRRSSRVRAVRQLQSLQEDSSDSSDESDTDPGPVEEDDGDGTPIPPVVLDGEDVGPLASSTPPPSAPGDASSSSSSVVADAAAPAAVVVPEVKRYSLDRDMCGAILADDMGLGKTLSSVCLLWTALNQGPGGKPLARRVIVVTPTSLVGNWSKEINKWIGEGRCPHVALSEATQQKQRAGLTDFLSPRGPRVLILSYEAFRIHSKSLTGKGKETACDLLICDEAHRLKNDATQTAQSLSALATRRRVLLSGTPIQNNLSEFYAMANFTNPGVFGSPREFSKYFEAPILEAREPGASDALVQKATNATEALSLVVNQFVLRRTNALLSEHLPPKLIQVVSCPLSPLQRQMYQAILASSHVQSIVSANNSDFDVSAFEDDDDDPSTSTSTKKKRSGALPVISMLRKICNHPMLALQALAASSRGGSSSSSVRGQNMTDELRDLIMENCDIPEGLKAMASGYGTSMRRGGGLDPMAGSKVGLLTNMLELLRARGKERIVVVSVFTQTLDLVAQVCRERSFPVIRLDGTITAGKRQKLVDKFNDPKRDEFVFLLSSRAGGCGLNLIGASRLVLFDPDWNPATDKQAAARVWRDGQKRRVFVYRFLAAGTLEEKVFQRQISKEGLHTIVVEEREEATALSSEALKELFTYDGETECDTHRAVGCERCGSHEDVPLGASQDWAPEAADEAAEENEGPRPPGPPLAASRRQLGQPEEADLARWSHHSDVKTVEDPVLCEAAGMTTPEAPLVSFVFGLQVPGCAIKEDAEDDGPPVSTSRRRWKPLHSSTTPAVKTTTLTVKTPATLPARPPLHRPTLPRATPPPPSSKGDDEDDDDDDDEQEEVETEASQTSDSETDDRPTPAVVAPVKLSSLASLTVPRTTGLLSLSRRVK